MFKKCVQNASITFAVRIPTDLAPPRSRFSPKEDVASNTILKSSSQRAIRQKLLQQLPLLAAPAAPRDDDPPTTEGVEGPTVLDRIWPKKESLFLVKW